MKRKKNIAIFSPLGKSYSETFIQEHKALRGNIFFYYGNVYNMRLEGGGFLLSKTRKYFCKIRKRLFSFSQEWYYQQILLRSLQERKIEVVLVEYGNHAQALLPVLKQSNLPFIVHFHGYDASIKQVIQKCGQYKEVFDTANFIVSVSKMMSEKLLSLGCPPEKLVYNVYGPHQSFLQITPNFSEQTFISIGRFVDKKAPYYLILSFNIVARKFPKAKLIMAGDGDLLETCKRLVHYLGLEKNIFFPGVINREQYQAYLSHFTGLVQHSIEAENGDSEGTPLSILEASAAGVPVISTRHGGIKDIINHGETGYLVEEHDVDGMADFMVKLIESRDEARELGSNGKKNISKNYNLQRHLSQLEDLIYSL